MNDLSPSVASLSYLEVLCEAPEFKNAFPLEAPITSLSIDSDVWEAYRSYGYLMAKNNPLALDLPKMIKELAPSRFGPNASTLVEKASALYCGPIGFEYCHLENLEKKIWLNEQIEMPRNYGQKEKKNLLEQLMRAEAFEEFLQIKYTGHKRFSLEGCVSLIPLLNKILLEGASLGLEECIIGMAHRGRLNVLAQLLHKPLTSIFAEFEESKALESEEEGDVKYHKGFRFNFKVSETRSIALEVANNPSHLEAVNPVIEGIAKAKQKGGLGEQALLPLLIHGDAALAGQGIVYETLQLSRLKGYTTGGTLHIVINNQIGFTTDPKEARSTRFCTDIARAFQIPVLHVNAEDPEACLFAGQLAIEWRQKFQSDLFIDLIGYRKYGHNEGDEPSYTQPFQYKTIRVKPSIATLYREQLIKSGALEEQEALTMENTITKELQLAFEHPREPQKRTPPITHLRERAKTSISLVGAQRLGEKLCHIPPSFALHPKLKQLYTARLEMVHEERPIDWGMAELLAYGSLLKEGISVRLSGQDVQRGTFSHRHCTLIDQEREAQSYTPLQHLEANQPPFEAINSLLSENGALGFEYGYSLASPETLVIWEAQFGDFVNGAQVITDQFIAAAEQKWGKNGPIVLFLPHGYEGQGPEHSSARIERFLTLSARENWRIANPSSPAQLFHLLRLQAKEKRRKPMVVFTPKGLLRHPECVSPLKDFTEGHFKPILDDPSAPEKPKRLILSSGRFYYDLHTHRRELHGDQPLLLRVEQLYPFHLELLQAMIKEYPSLESYYWAQEEPANMGGWEFIRSQVAELLPIRYAGRPRSASTATGLQRLHRIEHNQIIQTLWNA